ncbi:hypothetical protein [uncultured Clostridium sp.]|uniref:hypothetical protein n=1 Tax=uncultured Clostridium sp. TaxID=59620 RepID=UPI0026351AE2|nr:hypothetical protein [uncultured Clostridium sp.]
MSNGNIVYISPSVNVPFDKGALIPPPLTIATCVPADFLIASATVTPRGVTPAYLSWNKSNFNSVTSSNNVGAKSSLYFSIIFLTFSSTGKSFVSLSS